MPAITVIVPVYKVEPYLHRCVDSILAQTFTDFEVILVDDGSPDNCGAICDEYGAKDARVHVIHQANGGLSAARNAGIDWAFQNSDSQWLAFVDSDDWVHPRYLELLYWTAVESDVKVSICGVQRIYDEAPAHTTFTTVEVLDWENLLITGWQAVVVWNKLYAKELFETARYPLGKIHEDEYLTYKLLYRAQTIAHFSAELYYYFQNPLGITATPFSLRRLDALPALEERLSFVRQNGHQPLFLRDLHLYLYYCVQYAAELQNAEFIPNAVRLRETQRLRRRVRITILRYGFLYLPPKGNGQYYAFAFPGSYKAAKSIRKILKMIFHHY